MTWRQKMRTLGWTALLSLLAAGCHNAASCTSNKQCAAGLECDLSTGLCVGCVDDQGCSGATPHCLVAARQCVSCLGAGDCPMGQYCASDNTCADGCGGDS